MRILFVCTANVCRSPLAEGYMKSLVRFKDLKGLDISSAGIAAFTGAPPFECAVDVATLNEFDISRHRAQQLTVELAHSVDRILCMETWQAKAIMDMDSRFSGKVGLLGRFHSDSNSLLQIPDPRDFNVKETLVVFELIRLSVEGFLERVLVQHAIE